ncbi:MAG TPA: hypothetical protein VEZ20_13420 [Allosphingosinicella sp.]|nr:hypothetical protein [Allosphingosinicella sp.]
MADAEAPKSPVDLPGDAPEGTSLRWCVQIVAVMAALLAILNTTAIRSWASELAPGPVTEPVIAAADRLYEAASGLRLTDPVETMHGWWQGARAVRFASRKEKAPAPPEGAPAPEPHARNEIQR